MKAAYYNTTGRGITINASITALDCVTIELCLLISGQRFFYDEFSANTFIRN